MGQEKRQGERHKVVLPVQLESGGEAWIRDMSTSGVFFETDASLSPGAPIKCSVVLAFGVPGGPKESLLDCEGRIVRVERRKGKVGVAANITSYRVVSAKPYHSVASRGRHPSQPGGPVWVSA